MSELLYLQEIKRTCVEIKYNKKFEVVILLPTSMYNLD